MSEFEHSNRYNNWANNPAERQAFLAWRKRKGLSDAKCKRLIARFLGRSSPYDFYRVYGGLTREELQTAIETQLAREKRRREIVKRTGDNEGKVLSWLTVAIAAITLVYFVLAMLRWALRSY